MILTSVVEMQELGETSVMSPKPWLGTLHSHICLGPGGQSQVAWPDSKLARWRGGEVSSAPGAGGMSVCWAGRRSIAGCVVDLCFLSSHEETCVSDAPTWLWAHESKPCPMLGAKRLLPIATYCPSDGR